MADLWIDEYEEKVSEIVEDKEKEVDEKLSELALIREFKPVRASWFLAEAEIMYKKEKKTSAGYTRLGNKYFLWLHNNVNLKVQDFYAKLDTAANDQIMADYRHFLSYQLREERDEIQKVMLSVEKTEKSLVNDFEQLKEMAEKYLSCSKLLNYFILRIYDEYIKTGTILRRKWIEDTSNYGYLKETVLKKKTVIITDFAGSQYEAFILGRCFSGMGANVYILTPPEQIEIDAPIAIQDTVAVSMENVSEQYGIKLIPVIELVLAGKSLGNNCANIVDRICGEKTALILASSTKFEQLSGTKVLRNRIDNLCGYQENFRKDYYSFGWAGSYLSYIEQLYNMDVKEALYRQPTCRFSIVIPARNSAAILQHTLKTCLNQRWEGDFEIVISDNSTEGNNEVYQFCRMLQDKRVRYYKTPRDLRLNRSFEYAFLQTRGEYILSIGSDDALLPWTLEVWDQVIRDYPEEEIFAWDRGFYAWPGFNGGQQHQFTVPGKYQRGIYNAEYVEPIQFLGWAMENPNAMYLLPMLYINSGFKRSFMQTLLKNTGRLWDGICQDIYMGVMVSVIKQKIVKIKYPLAMAGMASGSVGAMANSPVTDQAKSMTAMGRELKENNVGGFSKSQIETLMPELGSDVTSLYNSILRAVDRGLIPRYYLTEVFDWKTWFLNSYRVMNKEDIYYDRKIHQMRYAAMKHGEQFLKWFDETIYGEALKPELLMKQDKTAKTYREHNNETGMTLDASKYGVHNVYEASLLFEKLTGL